MPLSPKFDRYASVAVRQAFVERLSQHLRMVDVTQRVTDCADAKDNKFLALALTVSAEMIVASDPHLTRMLASYPDLAACCTLVGASVDLKVCRFQRTSGALKS